MSRFRSGSDSGVFSNDTLCLNCGRRYGEHYGDDCPELQCDNMLRFFECYVEGTDGGRHDHHWTLQGAQTEAERLARIPDNVGKCVYLFECVGKCKVEQTPVKWEFPNVSK